MEHLSIILIPVKYRPGSNTNISIGFNLHFEVSWYHLVLGHNITVLKDVILYRWSYDPDTK